MIRNLHRLSHRLPAALIQRSFDVHRVPNGSGWQKPDYTATSEGSIAPRLRGSAAAWDK